MTPLPSLAERAGVDDLFVLHRVSGRQLINLDGHGRGAGWAGNVSVDPATEPWLSRAMDEGLMQSDFGFPTHLFGPYWATVAAGVLVGEYIVVFGGGSAATHPEGFLRQAAVEAVDSVTEIPAAKRLADELEVAQAALAVATLRPRSLAEAGTLLATQAAHALSCEFGAVLFHGPPIQLSLADEGWRPPATDDEIVASILPLAAAVHGDALIEQDVRMSPFPYPPLAFEDGLVARALVPLGAGGELGILLVAHAAGRPRGFTSLCQRVMRTMASTAEPMLDDVLAKA